MSRCKECRNSKRIDLPKSLTICKSPDAVTLAERIERMNWSAEWSYRRPVWFQREEWGCDNCVGFERR